MGRLEVAIAWHKWSLRIEAPGRAVSCALCNARIPKGTRTGRRISGAWWQVWKCHFMCRPCTLRILEELWDHQEKIYDEFLE